MFLNTLLMQLHAHEAQVEIILNLTESIIEPYNYILHCAFCNQGDSYNSKYIGVGGIFSFVGKSECKTWVRLIIASPPKPSMIHHEFQCQNHEGGVICVSLFETILSKLHVSKYCWPGWTASAVAEKTVGSLLPVCLGFMNRTHWLNKISARLNIDHLEGQMLHNSD